jgi:hypothetical protein
MLALPRITLRLVVLAAVLFSWYWLCRFTIKQGATVKYNGFEAFGPQVVDFLARINPYIWWVVVVIISLCFISAFRSWMHHSLAQGRAAIVPLGVFGDLCNALGPETLDVLRWVWKDPAQPITVGNLQTTLKQLRSGRVRKMALARAQRTELERALSTESDTQSAPASPKGYREPTMMA